MIWQKQAISVVLTLFLAACNATTAMHMPVVDVTGAPLVKAHEKLAPIAFEKAVVGLKRGTPVAHYPAAGNVSFNAHLCNYRYANNAVLEWGSGSSLLSGWRNELAEIFNQAMGDSGYNVVGDTTKLFKVDESRRSAKFLVAARIVDVRGNICEEHDWWEGRPMGRYAAEWYQDVEWTVFASLEQRVVGTFQTQGYARQDNATSQGVDTTFNNAFASAAEALAYKKDFYSLIASKGGHAKEIATPKGFSNISLPVVKLQTEPLQSNVDQSIRATVTIRNATGHGSGFVVSKDGYIITNQHVVGDAEEVSVVFSSGIEVAGQVLRSDAVRDVALIKIPLRNLSPLPIRVGSPLKRLDVVYAIGSPIYEKLKSTITRGIVSALRIDKDTKLKFIQSDVDIAGGNSGGPLLDEDGNVVGVSVAGIGMSHFSAGLNLFIPIDDALEYLNVTVANL